MTFDLSKKKPEDLINRTIIFEMKKDLSKVLFRENYQTVKIYSKITAVVENSDGEIIDIYCSYSDEVYKDNTSLNLEDIIIINII